MSVTTPTSSPSIPRVVAIALLAALAPLAAALAEGIHYRALTTTANDKGKEITRIGVEAWIDGESAKVEFVEVKGTIFERGNYLVTQDGGRTLYLVDPANKTYARWDLEAMLAATAAVLEGMGPLLKLEFSEPRIEKLGEEDGGTIVGLPTRHYRYRTAYSMKMKVLGMGRAADIVTEQDIWSTDAVKDAGLGIWLRPFRGNTGFDDLDRLIAAEMGKIHGFPLKTVARSTTTGGKGKNQQTTVTTTEVKEWSEEQIQPQAFALPQGYEERPFLPGMPTPEGG